MNPDDARHLAAFLHEAGHLKNVRRAGWTLAGVKDAESVAEHSYRVAVIGYVLAVMEGANPDRTAALCVFHDVPETRSGDVPSVGKRYTTTEKPTRIIADQTAHLPAEVAAAVRAVIGEVEGKETRESLCARDADKIECLLQARAYQAAGNGMVQPWVDTMLHAVRTESGKRLAAAAAEVPVDAWWHEFVASYGMTSGRETA